jgi:hypothetical protein
MKTAFAFMVVMASLGVCQDSTQPPMEKTWGMLNGRLWKRSSTVEKLRYVEGVRDGMLEADVSYNREDTPKFLASVSTFSEIIKAVDLFYQEPANMTIPIVLGLRFATMKAEGNDPAKIEAATIQVRKQIAEGQK